MLTNIVKLPALKEVLKTKPKVIIDFYASWCGPCKKIGPVFEELSKNTKGITFIKVNVDEAEELVNDYKVGSMPTFLAFHNEREVNRFAGANDIKLKEMIEQLTKL